MTNADVKKMNDIGPGGIKCSCCIFKTPKGYKKETRRILDHELEEQFEDYYGWAWEDGLTWEDYN